MDSENEIRKFVRLQIYKGRDLKVIFNDLCEEFCGKCPDLTVDELSLWYANLRCGVEISFPSSISYNERVWSFCVFEGPPALKFSVLVDESEDDDSIDDDLSFEGFMPRRTKRNFVEEEDEMRFDSIPPYEFHLPLQIICTEIGKAKRAYVTRKCTHDGYYFHCNMNLLSDRYAIDAGLDLDSSPVFSLVDILHNEKRKLQLSEELPVAKTLFGLVALNSTHVLCHLSSYEPETPTNTRYFELYLLKIDVTKIQCEVMDKYRFEGWRVQIIVDSVDPSKFLLCRNDENSSQFAQKCRLTDGGKLEIDDEKFDLHYKLPNSDARIIGASYRLTDEKLHGICHDNKKQEYLAFEATFERGRINFVQFLNLGEDCGVKYGLEKFMWSGTTCYFWVHDYDPDCFHLHKFDLETQKLVDINICVNGFGQCMLINNEVMLVCTVNSEFQHTWHRIPLNQPDTLLNLSMERLQRDAIFMDDVEYTKFVQKLPPNLRPFGQRSILNYTEFYDSDVDQQEPECSKKRELSGSSMEDCGVKKAKN